MYLGMSYLLALHLSLEFLPPEILQRMIDEREIIETARRFARRHATKLS